MCIAALGLLPGACVRRHFVLRKARTRQFGLQRLLHGRQHVLIRQRRRLGMKQGVRFERELVKRKVRGLERQRRAQIGECFVECLPRQAEHEIEIEVVEAGGARRLRGRECLVASVDASEFLQLLGLKALDADRQPVYAGRAVITETLGL